MSEQAAAADPYGAADRYCDIVMKGGITSGVVYPNAICELARTYRFKSVGGTSAGAIAASATAAAEYGRGARALGRSAEGFDRLAGLGEELAVPGRVRTLFQPQPATERLFEVLIGSLEGGFLGTVRATLRGSPVLALLGALPGLALVALAVVVLARENPGTLAAILAVVGVLLGLAIALLGLTVAVAGRLAVVLTRRVPDNGFGICSGATTAKGGPEGLTPWLTTLLNEAAGLRPEEPLTFAHLWAGPSGEREDPPPEGKRFLELQMMTTNLVNRVAQQVPWDDDHFYFEPKEFRRLFGAEVVAWMEANPRPLDSDHPRRSELHRAMMRPLLPLPAAADLPVVVAARLSLSFPVLLSAIPLWRFDFERPLNAKPEEKWDRWRQDQGPAWRAPAGNPREWSYDDMPSKLPVPEACWFSDGGISSNFPIHFFDRLVPGRPTFALNLRPFRVEEVPDPIDQGRNVEMATTNSDEIHDWWYRLPERGKLLDKRLVGFLMAAVKTMQNRVDEAQMRAPGFRDRVAHVKLSGDEGGMNLTMPSERVEALTERGEQAARLLRRAYTAKPSSRSITWDNHRWVRLRTALAVLEKMHLDFTEGFLGRGEAIETKGQSYPDLLARPEGAPPTSYKMKRAQVTRAQRQVAGIRALGEEGAADSVIEGSPKPRPVGRIMPR